MDPMDSDVGFKKIVSWEMAICNLTGEYKGDLKQQEHVTLPFLKIDR